MEGVFKLHSHQDKVLEAKERFIAVVSGIRGGKTTVGAVWMCNEIYRLYSAGVYGDFLISAPTVKILQQSTLPKFKEFFPSSWGEWKEQRSCFDLKWNRPGSNEPCRIFVRSMDDPNGIEGMDALAAWLDEVGQMRSQAWLNVKGRLSVHQGRCIMTTTPYAVNWFYKDIIKKVGIDPNIIVIGWTSSDNPAFPPEEYEYAKQSLPQAIFERRYMGLFTQLEGLVYPDFDEEKHIISPFEVPDSGKDFAGVDFGHTNPTAVICIREDAKSGIFYVFDEFYQRESSLQQLAGFVKGKSLSYINADPQSAQLIFELQRYHGIKHLRQADNNISVGIERIGSLIREGRLKISKKCKNTLDELATYHFPAPDSDKPTSDKPVAVHNHAMDALRYAFSIATPGLYKQERKVRQRFAHSIEQYLPDRYTGY